MKLTFPNRRKRLIWLISLMGISLLGVSGIQSYWIVESYQLKEEQFDQQVVEAMQSVSNRLETMENTDVIMASFNMPSLFIGQTNRSVNGGDSAIDLGEARLSAGFRKLSIQIDNDTLFHLNSHNPFATPADSTMSDLDREISYLSLRQKARQLDSVFRQLVLFNLQRGSGYQESLLKEHLDSILSFELRSRGIFLDYRYLVKKEDVLILNRDMTSEDQKQAYTSALFSSDVLAPSVLMVRFPKKANYLLSSIWLTLLISLLFTIAMVVTFYRTMHYSLQQKRINEIKTDFINNMTHEFKTPIATINLAIDALNNPKVIGSQERIRHYSELIRQENSRMHMQVESVLRTALMDKRELELKFEKVSIQKLLQSCVEHVRLSLESRGGLLNTYFNDDGVELWVDENHLSNTFINLLDNAIKYSMDAPQIKVTTEMTKTHIIVIVSDKGMGMSKDEQKHIFDRFYRVSGGNVHNIKGHGLGLSYARGIVEAHGGQISVESEKGEGSRFYVYLPLQKDK